MLRQDRKIQANTMHMESLGPSQRPFYRQDRVHIEVPPAKRTLGWRSLCPGWEMSPLRIEYTASMGHRPRPRALAHKVRSSVPQTEQIVLVGMRQDRLVGTALQDPRRHQYCQLDTLDIPGFQQAHTMERHSSHMQYLGQNLNLLNRHHTSHKPQRR